MTNTGGAGLAIAILCLLAATASCRREETKPERLPTQELPPLLAPASAYKLPVPGFADAVVAVPAGITGPAPVLVAVLGIGDTPERQCATWRELVRARAFVLCPRGVPHFVREEPPPAPDGQGEEEGAQGAGPGASDEAMEPSPDSGKLTQVGFYHRDVATLEREVEAGLASMRAKIGKYVADGPALYTGFSRGAFLGASLVARQPAQYPRAVFIEGGQDPWTDKSAAAFATNGGKRVLFACGRPSCVTESEAAAVLLGKHHVETRIVHAEGGGHAYEREVKEQLRASFDWVTEGDPLWRELLASTPKRAERK